MVGSMWIDAESAGAAASLLEAGIEGPLDLLAQVTPSLDAVIMGGAASPDSTANEADQAYPQPVGTLSEESVDAVPDLSVVISPATFAVDEEVSGALAAAITGSTPEGDEPEPVSAGPAEVPGGQEAVADPAAEAGSDESGDAAPAASMAMSVEGFDGGMGASSLVWGEPVDGGERIYYDDGTWAYTKPYVIGDETGDVVYDILPLPAEFGGGFEEESDGWLYVEETDEWVYLGWDEDWIYLDEWEDPGYTDDDGEWVYVDEWEDWGYVEGDEWVYADEGDGSNDAVSDPDVIVCWGYPDLMGSEVGDGDTVLPDGTDSAGEVFTVAILPLAVDDLFIA